MRQPVRLSPFDLAAGARLLLTLPLLLASIALVGCGGGGGAKNSVSGTVTTKDGKNVSGQVVLVSGGKEYVGPLLDGKYTVDEVPKGEADVLVKSTPGMISAPPPPKEKDMSKFQNTGGPGISPPAKYAQAGALPKVTVTGGKQTHNITLE